MLRSLAAALLLLAAEPSAAQTTLDLSPLQARQVALQAVLAGDAAAAREIAAALLSRDPNDRAALMVLAAAEPRLGRPAEGRRAAVRAWQLSESPARRYEAARLAALAAAMEGRTGLAGLWLRLALISAPNEAEVERTRQDATRLREGSPWRTDVELSFGPSDNVNGGSESPYNVIDGLPFVGLISVDGRALSGWEGTVDLRLARRIAESTRSRTELVLRLYGRGVALSEDSRELIDEETDEGDPEITGSDFSSTMAELRLGHDRLVGLGFAGADLALGSTWYGEELLSHSVRLSSDLAFPLAEGQVLRVSGSVEQRWDPDGERGDLRLASELDWSLRPRAEDRLTLSVSRGATLSDNGNAASASWGARATYAFGEALGPAHLSVTVGASRAEFPDYAVIFPVPGGREDSRVFANVEAVLDGWSWAGFAPVVMLEASRTDSNVSRFEGGTAGLGFALRSTF